VTAPDLTQLELAGETCARCDADMVITYDALRRPRKRCPRCDGVSRKAPPNADTVLLPMVLGAIVLPPIRPGQLRCQECACGVDPNRRFCPRCTRAHMREAAKRVQYKPKHCKNLSCGRLFTPTGARAEYCGECR
jgi:hypothetical protein